MAFVEARVETASGGKTGIVRICAAELVRPHQTGEFKVELLRFLNRERPGVVIVDWSAVQRAGTDSFSVMLAAQKRLHEWGGELRLCSMNPLLRDSFVQCGLTKLLPLHDDLPSACRASREEP